MIQGSGAASFFDLTQSHLPIECRALRAANVIAGARPRTRHVRHRRSRVGQDWTMRRVAGVASRGRRYLWTPSTTGRSSASTHAQRERAGVGKSRDDGYRCRKPVGDHGFSKGSAALDVPTPARCEAGGVLTLCNGHLSGRIRKNFYRAGRSRFGFRQVSPTMSITCAWCRRRSIVAAASKGSGKRASHSACARFDVNTVDRFSYR
jgi:hypothetical protein